jgi:hypothetical protein
MAEPQAGWRRGKRQTVRLACSCGKNLADVRLAMGAPPDEVYESPSPVEYDAHMWPFPRPGVRLGVHEHARETWGSHRFTFRLDCRRCGQTHEVRSNRIDAAWREYARPGQTITLILGRDL